MKNSNFQSNRMIQVFQKEPLYSARLAVAVCLSFMLFSFIQPLQAQPAKGQAAHESFHSTRILAKFKPKEKANDEHPVLKQYGLKIQRQHKLQAGLVTLDFADDNAAKAAMSMSPPDRAKALTDRVAKLLASGVFEYVEPDYTRSINITEPTDSAFTNGTLWGLHNSGQNGGTNGADIGAITAWDITTGSTNVIVAVIDTGIRYTHQDLAANMWHNPNEISGNNVDDDGDGYVDDIFGINALLAPKTNSLAGDPFDDNGHGTHVAGTIGAAANDGNASVGVAWNVRLMACKFLDSSGSGNVSDEIECINFALAKGAKIINASFGSSTYSQAEFDAIRTARDMGVLFVAAAGNSAANNDSSPSYPASYQLNNILSVAALDRFDRIAHFSNVGQTNVDLGAPGVGIFSCWNGSDTDYKTLDGTSMAAPHVSGVAALVWAANPQASMEEVHQRILVGAVPISSMNNFAVTGGRVNALNALAANNDGVMEVSVSPPAGAILSASSAVPVFVHVSDLFDLTNATVTGSVTSVTNLVFSNNGVLPDATANDGVYTAQLIVPSGVNSITLTTVAASSGKVNRTNTVSYVVLPAPANDDFSNRAIVNGSSNLVFASNVAATRENGEPINVNAGGRSVWWSWTAPATGWLTASTLGSSFDTILTVYSGANLTNLSQVAASTRNYFFNDTNAATSELNCFVTAGTNYQIMVDGFRNAAGQVVLQLVHVSQPPPNDNFANRITLIGTNFTVVGANLLATVEPGEPYLSYTGSGSHSVWWRWTAPANGRVAISTEGSDYDTIMGVYTGGVLTNLSLLAYSDDVNYPYDVTSAVEFDAVAGTEYQITVDGYLGSMGNIQLNLNFITAPPNDNFANRTGLTGTNVTASGANVGATREIGEPGVGGGYTPSHTVWWSWTAPGTGRATLTVAGDNTFSKLVSIYIGSTITNLVQVAASGASLTNVVGFDVQTGVEYVIQVDGYPYSSPSFGNLTLNLNFTGAPPNDNFANRAVLTGTNVAMSGSNVGATREAGEPNHGYYYNSGSHSVWWTWTAPGTGRVSVQVGSATFGTAVDIYTGSMLTNLTGVASASGSLTNTAGFDVVAGTTYQIAVAGYYDSYFGSYTLGLTFTAAPANDNFADRIVLAGTNVAVSGSNVGATREAGEPSVGGYTASHSVWWSWTAAGTGRTTVTVGGDPSVYKLINIYTGSVISNLTQVTSGGCCTTTNTVSFDVQAGVEYEIQVDGYPYSSPSFGNLALNLNFTGAPPNDNFTNRTILTGTNVTVAGSNVGATREAGEPSVGGYTASHSVWWSWMAAGTGRTTVTVGGDPSVYKLINIYTGLVISNLTQVTSGGCCTTTNTVSFDVQAGVEYEIQVDGYPYSSPSFGNLALNLNFTGAPPNDNFTNRMILTGTNVTVAGSNVGASKEAGELSVGGGYPTSHSVWWSWTAPGTGRSTVTVGGDTSFYKLISIYTGSVVSNLTQVAAGGCCTSTNVVGFDVQPGVEYEIQVDGYPYSSPSFGNLTLNLNFTASPPNDNFTNRTILTGTNVIVAGSNLGATKETGEPSHGYYGDPHSVWWTWTAPTNGRIVLQIASTNFGSAVEMYTGTVVSNLTGVAGAYLSGAGTNPLVYNARSGVSYQISVAGYYQGSLGAFLLDLSFTPAPANDNFTNRIVLSGTNILVNGSNIAATSEAGEPSHAGSVAQESVWWTWAAPRNGHVVLRTAGSSFDTRLAVYTGASVSSLTSVAANDDASGSILTSLVSFDVASATNYQIAVDGYSSAEGTIQLGLAFSPAPPNDDFARRSVLSGTVALATGSNLGATRETGEPSHGGYASGHSVWWTWTAPTNGNVQIIALGDFSNVLAIYTNSPLSNLVSIASSAISGTAQNAAFAANAGVAYQIAVDGKNGTEGNIQLIMAQNGATKFINAAGQTNGSIHLSLIGQMGAVYTIQTSTNLVRWLPLCTVTNQIGSVDFNDTINPGIGGRFYRAMQMP